MTSFADRKAKSISDRQPVQPSSLWAAFLKRFCKNRTAVAGLTVFIIICIACVFAPYLTRYQYTRINIANRASTPSREHILGTDNLGRDTLTRLLYGGRVTLRVALVATSLALAAGGALGLTAGFYGGKVDFIISPVLDALASIPVILLVVVIETMLGRNKGYFMYAIALAAVPQFARLVRASVMGILSCEYIEAARALGVRDFKIITRHVIHNIAPPVIVRFASGVSESLMYCTIMGYLSIGIRPPHPEWGAIVFQSRVYLRVQPISLIIPCAVIAVTVISINLFSDGLRDAFDPRQSN